MWAAPNLLVLYYFPCAAHVKINPIKQGFQYYHRFAAADMQAAPNLLVLYYFPCAAHVIINPIMQGF